MKKLFLISALAVFIFVQLFSQSNIRREINIPNIEGYVTLKCDFHIHTVFSDGMVWPTVRVKEAWKEGLDVIAYTDHLEYQPHKKDISTDHNRATDIGLELAEQYNIIVIRGTEITRKKPMGHINAIFTLDNNPIFVADSMESINIAKKQNAFITWNHPSEKYGKWSEIQDILYKNSMFQGIEVANHNTYYPDAHQWCIDKNLTMMGTSDVHEPIDFDYNFAKGERRTMTLVFATQRTSDAVKQALIDRNTVVFWKNKLLGNEKFLKPIFNQSVSLQKKSFTFKKGFKNKGLLLIKNNSDLSYTIKLTNTNPEMKIDAKSIVLEANSVTSVSFDYKSDLTQTKNIVIPAEIENLYVLPNTPLKTEMSFEVKVQ